MHYSLPHTLRLLALALVVVGLHSVAGVPLLYAQTTKTATQGATTTQESLEETTEKAIEGIKKRIEDSAGKVKGVLQKRDGAAYSMVGQVQRISDTSLTFRNAQGTTILALNDQEVNITKKNVAMDLTDIAVDDWITLLGYKNTEEFIPRIIFVSEASLQPKIQKVSLGTITQVTATKLTILDRLTQEELTFTIAKTSNLQDADGKPTTAAKLETDLNILVAATKAEDDDSFTITTLKSLAPPVEEDDSN